MPELYLLTVFASIFQYSFTLIFLVLTLFGWVHLSDYVRIECLRNRQMEYVRAARALGSELHVPHDLRRGLPLSGGFLFYALALDPSLAAKDAALAWFQQNAQAFKNKHK